MAQNGTGMKWDGHEMVPGTKWDTKARNGTVRHELGRARNGTGLKWDTRARNGMGTKWDGHEMGRSGTKWDGHEMGRHEMVRHEMVRHEMGVILQKFFAPSSSSSLGSFHPYFAVVGGKGAAIQRRYKCEISFGNASFIVPGSEMDVNVAKDNLSPSLPSHSPVNYISDVSGLDPAGLNSLTTADSPYIFF